MYHTHRRSPLGPTVRTAVLALMLTAGTMTPGVAAWADEPAQGDHAQSQQPTPTTQPTPTRPTPTTQPTPTRPTPTTQPTPTSAQPKPTSTSTPSPPTPARPIPVRVTPQAGGAGTTVQLTAQVGQCHRVYAWFYDSKSEGVTIAGGAKPIKPLRVTAAGTLTASYTVTRKDATGPARFSAVCGLEDGTARAGQVSFQVRAPGGGTGAGAGDNNANRNAANRTDASRTDGSQIPTQIDTGLGGTADGGIDPVWLLLPAGLLLIAVAAWLRLRQATARRRW